MSTLISSFVQKMSIIDVQTSNNMTIVQLSGIDKNFPKVLPFSEAFQRGFITITEVAESGRVSEILAENLGDQFVLLLEGEVIVGAKQNRTINTTILIAPKSMTKIPVSCVERGRWSYREKYFSPSDIFVPPEIRAKKVASVSETLQHTGNFNSDQEEIWDEVFARLEAEEVDSPSSDFKDYYACAAPRVENYQKQFRKHSQTTGIVVFINGKPVGCDVIPQPEIFSYFFDRLLKSYALDALYTQSDNRVRNNFKLKAKDFLSSLSEVKEEVNPSPGVGNLVQISGENITGSALVYQISLIHLALFVINRRYENI